MSRPNPDDLLKYAKIEEASESRGKLKIFLGYSAGVGKTYAMLETVKRLKKDGVDIVIGYVEPHKRAETEALLEGQEIIPRKSISYRGATLFETNVDALLERRPKVVVVDELAHTNVPGSRHTKRHQDVEELLAAGIDVFTTLNIQHLESLNDMVAKITGISMQETVPDTVLDNADEIEVVDLPIGDLLKRFKEGKIYVADQAAHAMQNFFSEANLTALRELTLRRAAKRVGSRKTTIQGRPIPGQRSAAEKLVVCVTSYSSSIELVRAAKLLAVGLDADWYAVYVETIGQKALSEIDSNRLTRTMRLAEELGGKPVTLSGRGIPEELVAFADKNEVTKILIGKPIKRRLRDILFGSVVDRLIRLSGDIDVHVVSRAAEKRNKKEEVPPPANIHAPSYALGFVLVAFATVLSAVVREVFDPTSLVMFYLLTVVVCAVFLGRGPSTFAAVLSVLAFDFFFVPPYFTFSTSDPQYWLTFVVLLVVGVVISSLAARIRHQAESVRFQAAYTAALYGLSRDLAIARDTRAVLSSLSQNVKESLGAHSAVFLIEQNEFKLIQSNSSATMADNEMAVAEWTAKNAEAAGWSTDTIPGAAGYYLPLKTARGVLGVLGVYLNSKSVRLPLDKKNLLEAFASQSALAVERIQLSEEAQRSRILEEREKLQSALFNSISHDLRTPLVSITGSLSGMLENLTMDVDSRKDLLENAYEEAVRLNRLVGNLLDMARLEANALRLAPSPCEIRDVIGAALKELELNLSDRKVTVTIEDGLPHIPMDFSLMMKVLVNLIDNAVKYAPFGLPIDIDARSKEGRIEIKVLDRGLGIPQGDLEPVFDKFYRVKRPQNIEGTGLGLSICKGIVEAHQGTIWAENRPGGGTIVTISLPLKTI